MRAAGPLLAAALLACAHVAAARAPLWTLADPAGDDHGDGSLIYPGRDDMHQGDLDLVSLSARPAEHDGTLFEATFAKPIVQPDGRAIDIAGTPLSSVAKHGFYTFNIDIYIDEDRQPGSGRTDTLPGRKAEIDPASAWEQAVVLVPRPIEARNQLVKLWQAAARREREARGETLDSEQARALERSVEREVDARVFFPNRIRVTGAKVEFYVPGSFFGLNVASPTWSYVVAVTGADITRKFDVPALLGREPGPDEALMMLGIGPGYSKEQFGGGRELDPLQPPLVDIIVPPGHTQEELLRRTGLQKGQRTRLPGVVPQ